MASQPGAQLECGQEEETYVRNYFCGQRENSVGMDAGTTQGWS